MRDRTRQRVVPREEITCLAMLLGENQPIICSCCLGKGWDKRLWGVRTCGQCGGSGYDWIGPKTKQSMIDQGIRI